MPARHRGRLRPGLRAARVRAITVLATEHCMSDEWSEFTEYLERERAFSGLPSEYWASNCYVEISLPAPAPVCAATGIDRDR